MISGSVFHASGPRERSSSIAVERYRCGFGSHSVVLIPGSINAVNLNVTIFIGKKIKGLFNDGPTPRLDRCQSHQLSVVSVSGLS